MHFTFIKVTYSNFLFSLTHLSLGNNLLHLSDELSFAPLRLTLASLLLPNNGFSRFPNIFKQSFGVLRTLDLSNNQLSVVPTGFQVNTPHLESLKLDNNHLEHVIFEVSQSFWIKLKTILILAFE